MYEEKDKVFFKNKTSTSNSRSDLASCEPKAHTILKEEIQLHVQMHKHS